MNFKFYLFGVPDGFDLFDGSVEDTKYFRPFYDGSKTNTKLTIHRGLEGQVSYTFLKYNLVSCENRSGAFFAFSIVFNGQLCTDILGLFSLFEAVFDTILKKAILLKEIKKSNSQAIFQIHEFREAGEEIGRIKGIIRKNIDTKFTNDFINIDDTFRQEKPNLIRKVGIDGGNAAILTALKEYSWVSVSPEYKEIVDEISEEGKKELKSNLEKVKNSLVDYSLKIATGDNHGESIDRGINQLNGFIDDNQRTIQKYLKNQPELNDVRREFYDLQRKLKELKQVTSSGQRLKPSEHQSGSRPPNSHENRNEAFIQETNSKTKKYKGAKHSTIKAAITLAAVSGVALLLWYFHPRKKECSECILLESNNKFKEAIIAYRAFGEATGNNVDVQIGNIERKAIEDIKEEARIEFENANVGKMVSYYEVVNTLNKAKVFNYNPEPDIEDYKGQTIEYYFSEIAKEIDNSKKLTYIEYILGLDPNNIGASNLKENMKLEKQALAADSQTEKQSTPTLSTLFIAVKKGNKTLEAGTDNKIEVTKGDKLQVTISNDEAGRWHYDDNYIEPLQINNTYLQNSSIEIKITGKEGESNLSYKTKNDVRRASVTFRIIEFGAFQKNQ